jgi:hypothetical protein
MTLMKSLLLGSAAGVVAVASAQGADLPTRKAAPVAEYVKVCNSPAFGAGFVLPGSDTCLKISGGFGVEAIVVQRTNADIPTSVTPSLATGNTLRPIGAGVVNPGLNGMFQTTVANPLERYGLDGRAWVVFDAANNTPMGWITSEAQINANTGNSGTGGNGTSLPGNYGGTGAGLDHAWAKWAGLEIHGADGSLFNIGTNQTMITDSFGAADIGGTAWIGYVGHFGGGFLAGVAIEDANGHIQNNGTVLGNTYHYSNFPDFTAKLGVEQGWGSAYVSGIIHNTDASNAFWGDPITGAARIESTDTTGWGIAGAVKFNATPALTLNASGLYTYGIAKVFAQGLGGASQSPTNLGGTSLGVGVYGNGGLFLAQDAIATPGGGYGIAEVWGANLGAAYQVNPALSLALEGSYGHLNYSADPVIVAKTISAWSIGGDANWKPIANLTFDLDIMYTAATSDVPTDVVPGAGWNKSSDGFLGRLQISRTF